MNDNLRKLLDRARECPITPEQIREQKISFIYGQLMDCNPNITREQVASIVDGE